MANSLRKRRMVDRSVGNSNPSRESDSCTPSVSDWKDYESYLDRKQFAMYGITVAVSIIINVIILVVVAVLWGK